MAITIKQSPQRVMPVYNNIVFTVDSTNKTQCNFNYLCDVYVNGVYVTRLKRLPKGTSGYGEFEVNRVLEDYIGFDYQNNLNGFTTSTNSILYYELKFGEEYDTSANCDAGTTIFANLLSSDSIASVKFQAFNGALQYKEWITWNWIDYQATNGIATKKFLTKIPNNVLIKLNDRLVMSIFNNAYNATRVEVKTYDKYNTLIGTYAFDNPSLPVTSFIDIVTVGVGPENINNTTLTIGTQPVITNNVKYYTVQMIGIIPNYSSELKTFTIDKRLSKFESFRFWFLNKLGVFDSYSFTLSNTQSLNINRSDYNKLYGQYVAPSTWTYNFRDRGTTTSSVEASQNYNVNSNWLTEYESDWLNELVTSNEVYLISENTIQCPLQMVVANNEITFSGLSSSGLTIGQSLILCISPLWVPSVVTVVSLNPLITTNPSFGDPSQIANGTYSLTDAMIIPLGYNTELDPINITNQSYQLKDKTTVKNIQQSIEFKKSYKINTQRN
jgi:hypothetical protein